MAKTTKIYTVSQVNSLIKEILENNLPSRLTVAGDENPFRYGWRYVRKMRADGKETWEQVPLTLEDVLHPREEDCIPEHPAH